MDPIRTSESSASTAHGTPRLHRVGRARQKPRSRAPRREASRWALLLVLLVLGHALHAHELPEGEPGAVCPKAALAGWGCSTAFPRKEVHEPHSPRRGRSADAPQAGRDAEE